MRTSALRWHLAGRSSLVWGVVRAVHSGMGFLADGFGGRVHASKEEPLVMPPVTYALRSPPLTPASTPFSTRDQTAARLIARVPCPASSCPSWALRATHAPAAPHLSAVAAVPPLCALAQTVPAPNPPSPWRPDFRQAVDLGHQEGGCILGNVRWGFAPGWVPLFKERVMVPTDPASHPAVPWLAGPVTLASDPG